MVEEQPAEGVKLLSTEIRPTWEHLPVWHEVARIQDDGRQHKQEEGVRSERGGDFVTRQDEQEANHNTHDDQQARLGEDVMQHRGHVEA